MFGNLIDLFILMADIALSAFLFAMCLFPGLRPDTQEDIILLCTVIIVIAISASKISVGWKIDKK